MSAPEAVALGFCTSITEAEAQMAAAVKPEDLGSAPEHVQRLFAAGEVPVMKTKAKAEAPTISTETVAREAAERAAAEAASALETAKAQEAASAEAAAQASAAKAEDDKMRADMEEMRALLAKKDEEINALKAKFGKEDEEEEDPEANAAQMAVIAAAKELTGKADLAELEGALLALADQPKADPKAEHKAFVAALVKEGKLAPSRQKWAESAPRASVDTYLAGTGGARLVPVGQELAADEKAARNRAGLDPNQVELTPEEIHVAKAMNISLDMARKAKCLTLTGAVAN
jgi:hypothetical protein